MYAETFWNVDAHQKQYNRETFKMLYLVTLFNWYRNSGTYGDIA